MTTLLLVRHGSTEWNASGRLQGVTDIALSPEGEREALRLRPLVEAWAPTAVVASPLRRAAATARLLIGHEPPTDPRLVEVGLGDWEGRTAADIGDEVGAWRRGELVPPGGEDAALAAARIRAALDDAVALAAAASDSGGTVLVVTHGGVVRAALGALVGLATRHIAPVPPASLTVVDLSGGVPRLRSLGVVPEPAAARQMTRA
ncbi:histidine phosphatase family protein [Agrococcus baldri]|uniref:Phosphoglycerate mutase n=1 Tax=Agrococcus baldri TaxID=153730 RepID=A0AA87URV6_9MICO|nr:histidine phosphatase family protein [Agrococcus baldri]GEK80278.1 hypothetical protein ABA31_16290 [Agrococcus baldri]